MRATLALVSIASAVGLIVACSSSPTETVQAEPDAAAPAVVPFDAGDPDASEDGGGWSEDQCCRAVLWGDRRGDACCHRWIDDALRDH